MFICTLSLGTPAHNIIHDHNIMHLVHVHKQFTCSVIRLDINLYTLVTLQGMIANHCNAL